MQENAKAAERKQNVLDAVKIYIQARAFETSESSQSYQNCEKDRRTAIAKKTQCKKYFLIPTKSDHVEPQEEFLRQHLYVCTVENLPTFFFCVMQGKCGRFAVCHFVSGCKNSYLANGRIFPATFRRCKTLKQRIHRAACNHVALTPKLCKIFTGGSV